LDGVFRALELAKSLFGGLRSLLGEDLLDTRVLRDSVSFVCEDTVCFGLDIHFSWMNFYSLSFESFGTPILSGK
jgi:hypothetical protein